MAKIAKSIQDGAMAFLKAEYKILLWFVIAVALLLYWSGSTNENSNEMIAVAFVVGAFCSALAGYLGMKVATKANVRTANAAQDSLGKALEIAFSGGSVMGLGVVGLGILGLGGLFYFFGEHFGAFDIGSQSLQADRETTLSVLTGFSFGASSIALFARVGGGIYTKAADVGADLVGKVEAGIPEDHPLNPATIADNVGDNVGRRGRDGSRFVRIVRRVDHRHHDFGSGHGLCGRFQLFRPGGRYLRRVGAHFPAFDPWRHWNRNFHFRNLSRQGQGRGTPIRPSMPENSSLRL